MTNEGILLQDILRFPEAMWSSIKVKFNTYQVALDEYLEDSEKANCKWSTWRYEKNYTPVGTLVLVLMPMPAGRYLLSAVRRITGDNKVADSYGYKSEDVVEYARFFGRVVIDPKFKLTQQYFRLYESIAGSLYVHEILPDRFSGRSFPGLQNIRIGLSEIRSLNEHARTDWINALNHQKGVYLITDKKTGKKYVGSAHGAEGLWQRWLAYCYTGGHGGNVELINLLKQDENYGVKNFEFAVLETFGSATPDQAILEREQWWKETLRTELNRN